MSVRPGIRRVAPLVVVAIALVASACRGGKSRIEGAYLGLDDRLLLEIDADGDVVFQGVLGEGTCVALGEGEIEDDALTFDGGSPVDVRFERDAVVLDDPDDLLSGTYDRVDREDHCFVVAPEPGDRVASATEIIPGASRPLGSDGAARTASIPVGGGVGTLAVYLIGQDVGWGLIEPRAFRDPGGADLLGMEPYLTECGTTFCTVLLPKIPGFDPTAGTYAFEFGGEGDIDDLHVIAVTRPLPIDGATVRLHAVVGPTTRSLTAIGDALEGVVAALAGFGITAELDPLVTASSQDFASLPVDFLNPRAQALLALGEPDAINVFFLDDLVGIEGLYGIAAGIPGTVGVVGPWNGVLINLTTHEGDPSGDFVSLLRDTVVHEAGHLLGLYHTTEAEGTFFDPLLDTPECRAAIYDADRDGTVLADECEGVGGDNVMFWTPSVSALPPVAQDVLTEDQRVVLEHVVVGE